MDFGKNTGYMFSDKNTFTVFLELLKVKHTRYYTGKLFNEHPHKYNLFGLSDMLSVYRIENAAFRIDRKEDIYTVMPPFVAHIGSDFAVVDKVSPMQIGYIWKGKHITVSVDNFLKIWSGVILMAEPGEESVEPDFRINKRQENIRKVKNSLMAMSVAAALIVACIMTRVYMQIGLLSVLLLNLAGLYISYLLLLKHLHIQGHFGDKICSLFKQRDCNNLLESDAASLFSIISWSEIGLAYFISNAVIVLYFPNLLVWTALINVCVLPYSFWSIWYQKFKAKQWCMLCVIVQVLLWMLFLVNLSFDFIRFPVWDSLSVVIIGCIYLIPLLLVSGLVSLFADRKSTVELTQEINSIKANEQVFVALLGQQPRYEVSYDYSHILWGDPKAKLLLTVLTNPHCNPCAKMHSRIGKLLKMNKNVQVQYVFSSFSSGLEISARYLIAVYQQKNREECERIYAEWFEYGKFNKESFFEKYIVDTENKAVTDEFNRHETWKKMAQLHATPTLLVNGYKLPESYRLEDLKYFTDLEFEI